MGHEEHDDPTEEEEACCCVLPLRANDDEEDRGRRGVVDAGDFLCRCARILDAVDERANMAGNSGRAGMVRRAVVRDIDHVRDAGADVVRNEQQEYLEISVRVDCTAEHLRYHLDVHVRERGPFGEDEVDVGVRDILIFHANTTVFRVE